MPSTDEQCKGGETPARSRNNSDTRHRWLLTHNRPWKPLGDPGLASLHGRVSEHGEIVFLASVTDLRPSHSPLLPHLLLECHILITDSRSLPHEQATEAEFVLHEFQS